MLGFLIKHELLQIAKSRTLYISLFICYAIFGFIVWLSPANVLATGYASATFIFNVFYWLALILLPSLVIRNTSVEKALGTIELILTKQVHARELITSKFLAMWIVGEVILLLSLPYCLTLSYLGNLDWSATLCGYIALSLHCALVIAISLSAATLNKLSFNALFTAWIVILIVLWLPTITLPLAHSRFWESLLLRLSVDEYFNYMIRGSLYLHSVILYLLLTLWFTILACFFLVRRQEAPKRPIRYIVTLTLIPLLCLASSQMPYRFDLSGNKRYSLNPITIQTIQNNTKPIRVNLYYSEEFPESSMRLLRELGILLRSYRMESETPFEITLTKVTNEETEMAAERDGLTPIYSKENEKIFFGASFHIGDEKRAVIDHINANTPFEYEITRIIREASNPERPNVGILYGHGESKSGDITLFTNELKKSADLKRTDINFTQSINQFDVICIIGPQLPFSPFELQTLREYLQQGGRLFIALRHATGEIRNPRGSNWFTVNRTGLEDFLEEMGMKINYDFIVDNNCGTLSIQQTIGTTYAKNNIRFPLFPIITHFSGHTVTSGLSTVMLPFASSIEQVRTPTTYVFQELLTTSAISGTIQPPILFSLSRGWRHEDFKNPGRIVAALLTNEEDSSAIITITNATFLNDDVASLYGPGNINFAVNAVEWLENNVGLVELRNKYSTMAILETLSKASSNSVKILNVTVPLFLIVAIFALVSIVERTRHRGRRKFV